MDEPPLLSSPIPIANLATSHVNQLEHSPPHPIEAFSPASFTPLNGFAASALISPNSPIITSTSPHSSNSSPRKVHPADLVSINNPDPHISPNVTPIEEITSPYSPSIIESSTDDHSILGRTGLSKSEEASGGGGIISENGAHVGHGSEEENHELNLNLDQQELPIASSSKSIPFNNNGQSVEPHHSNQLPSIPSINSQSVPSKDSEDTTTNLTSTKSITTNSSGIARDRRDKEREREQREVTAQKEKERESTRSRRVLGEWTMSKTLGAGSMGKVKLGISSITGEKVAIKIIPRFTSTAAAHRSPSTNGSNNENGRSASPRKEREKPSASFLAKATAKDASKEVRTMREASLSMLLHHPYVCGMKSMFLYPNHYYMVFEYVNGGQMLDYIISHGRLRERSARKFARQIGSALEYCHANSIVHRDLKIENILISKTGNIKIIDFGLSNLYSPMSHLNTFCGSLYFAAPELLNAKSYTGPEVDVWSFGIVLYVLVCGKVPFDDQSMPALHAKIKRGQVDYPNWLSAECKHLLSRMLVTIPSQRATLTEIFAHPWMMKGGFTGPPASHLPPRSPLRIEEIDREVIKGMVGFEFGSEVDIHGKLLDVLESELYINAVRAWDIKQGLVGNVDGESKIERPSTRVDGKDMKGARGSSKRFSGLGFYGKKIAGGLNAAFANASIFPKADEINEGTHTSVGMILPNGLSPDTLDPTRGFHPLISIYYLVREKIEREQIWGAGVFASSTLSLTGPLLPPEPAQAYQSGSGVLSTVEPAKPSAIHGPQPPAPPQLPPSTSTSATPRPIMTPQPRQRATGEQYPQHPATAPRPSSRDTYNNNRVDQRNSSFQPISQSLPVTPNPQDRSNQSSNYQNNDESGNNNLNSRRNTTVENSSEDTPLSSSPQGSFARRFGSLLGRHPSSPEPGGAIKGHRQRASIAGTSHKAGQKTTASILPQVEELNSPQNITRSNTVAESSPSSRHHNRGNSIGSGPISLGKVSGETFNTRRQMSLVPNSPNSVPTTRPRTMMGSDFDERVEEELINQSSGGEQDLDLSSSSNNNNKNVVDFIGRTAAPSSNSEHAKPVWLKGLFSVATTTTKSTAVLRIDLVKVLDRLGVQHREVKSGYECFHAPSIDLSSLNGGNNNSNRSGDEKENLKNREGSVGNRERTTTSSTSFTVITSPSGNVDELATSPSTIKRAITPPTTSKFNSSTGEGSNLSSDLIVRFEIFIVKMPLIGIKGVQFRRISGNSWAYQMLAKRILQELKL